ncbi:aromatic ring-hydroxylating dioxygenase subunit alpha [Peribacillus simplex]|uniref:aromatic ring-hydroxylating dioxygenase subunit alpha n=1 Tax=Peribacillus TaxID=2675229 RepID=UPI001379CA10|nr:MULTISPECIES: aromatic ring-hydroxylating dioxygenase subunit alpha [Peribacillus]MBD8590377.1 aromatic ring-hydroxylating dioxygenase subunit alpha [Peribacillus simplex]NCT39680.1 aromatic ring-hydroxylating dioxygenase subunit alpha [Peribacillus frigoritolerans]WMX58745.1 aromatic ring-hydroxylating dioxygenase subunit alpha [Peribacillus sp. R9-11]
MLSKEQNEDLIQVGAGKSMGELLRRYWHPIAISTDVEKIGTIKKLKILDEELVLYRDKSNNLGLVADRCAHRGVSLEYAIPDECGLRCQYHGWLYDQTGQCVEQPNEPEDSTFKKRIKISGYEVRELGGLVFGYMGPKPAPELPNWDLFVQENVIRTVGYAEIPCNWVQIMENSLDPTHLEWLHGHYFEHVFEQQGRPQNEWPITKRHLKIGFDEFDYGIIKRRVLEGQTEENEDWAVGHPIVFPNYLRVGDSGAHSFQIRVPIDDTHTLHFWYTCFVPAEGVKVPENYPISSYECPIYDENGKFVTDYIDGQDMMAWITQGPVADRTVERLGTSDKGIIMYRQMLKRELKKMKNGEDPKCTIRDPQQNQYIELPQEEDKFSEGGLLSGVAIHWNTRYAPNLHEIIEICKGEPISSNS